MSHGRSTRTFRERHHNAPFAALRILQIDSVYSQFLIYYNTKNLLITINIITMTAEENDRTVS